MTEFFDFINRDIIPSRERQKHLYAYINVDEELKYIRREYRLHGRKIIRTKPKTKTKPVRILRRKRRFIKQDV